ncbi:hypothetical protein AYI68_g5047 [Smittium mucronatum]|uniref:Uncharacterized protein n=1 Tax=Smittium mucronatum TaxID=133383 RepID=A0A1R0GVB7_9FUNG|nr:hypothetical protein AYI68_g5047 [Smittium mucronatum]
MNSSGHLRIRSCSNNKKSLDFAPLYLQGQFRNPAPLYSLDSDYHNAGPVLSPQNPDFNTLPLSQQHSFHLKQALNAKNSNFIQRNDNDKQNFFPNPQLDLNSYSFPTPVYTDPSIPIQHNSLNLSQYPPLRNNLNPINQNSSIFHSHSNSLNDSQCYPPTKSNIELLTTLFPKVYESKYNLILKFVNVQSNYTIKSVKRTITDYLKNKNNFHLYTYLEKRDTQISLNNVIYDLDFAEEVVKTLLEYHGHKYGLNKRILDVRNSKLIDQISVTQTPSFLTFDQLPQEDNLDLEEFRSVSRSETPDPIPFKSNSNIARNLPARRFTNYSNYPPIFDSNVSQHNSARNIQPYNNMNYNFNNYENSTHLHNIPHQLNIPNFSNNADDDDDNVPLMHLKRSKSLKNFPSAPLPLSKSGDNDEGDDDDDDDDEDDDDDDIPLGKFKLINISKNSLLDPSFQHYDQNFNHIESHDDLVPNHAKNFNLSNNPFVRQKNDPLVGCHQYSNTTSFDPLDNMPLSFLCQENPNPNNNSQANINPFPDQSPHPSPSHRDFDDLEFGQISPNGIISETYKPPLLKIEVSNSPLLNIQTFKPSSIKINAFEKSPEDIKVPILNNSLTSHNYNSNSFEHPTISLSNFSSISSPEHSTNSQNYDGRNLNFGESSFLANDKYECSLYNNQDSQSCYLNEFDKPNSNDEFSYFQKPSAVQSNSPEIANVSATEPTTTQPQTLEK